jgi:hypothetical protein
MTSPSFRDRIGDVPAQIGQQEVLARVNSPRERLTDRAGTDDHDNIGPGDVPPRAEALAA